MKQDKGRGIAIIDRSNYTDERLEFSQTNIKHSPTESYEGKF